MAFDDASDDRKSADNASALRKIYSAWLYVALTEDADDKEDRKVIEIDAISKARYGFLFAFYSNYCRICSRLWDI